MDSPQLRRWRNETLIAVVITVVWVAELQFRIGGPNGVRWFANVALVLAAGAAAVSCGVRAWRDRKTGWLPWALLTLSALSWAAGRGTWMRLTGLPGGHVPFPSMADAGSLAAVPLLI